MSVSSILRPLAGTYGGSMTNPERAGTADPKEVAFSTGAGARTLDIDLGSAQSVGAVYLGGVSGVATWQVYSGLAAHGESYIGQLDVANKRTATAPRQYLLQFAPANARYIRFSAAALTDGFEVGVAVACERFSPTWGHEWGAGRSIVDTGSATRNRAGGFGIDKGAIVAGWEWTLGDLTDLEREVLFDMLKKVGETSPIVVAEDPDQTTDLDARLHYGLFTRLEKYERQSVGVTRWSFKMEEWR